MSARNTCHLVPEHGCRDVERTLRLFAVQSVDTANLQQIFVEVYVGRHVHIPSGRLCVVVVHRHFCGVSRRTVSHVVAFGVIDGVVWREHKSGLQGVLADTACTASVSVGVREVVREYVEYCRHFHKRENLGCEIAAERVSSHSGVYHRTYLIVVVASDIVFYVLVSAIERERMVVDTSWLHYIVEPVRVRSGCDLVRVEHR